MTASDKVINSKKAASFLQSFRGQGYINVVAIDPHSKNVTGITRPVESAEIGHFIEKNNGKRNLYFMVNEPKADAPDTKLKKEHVEKVHAVWLDADPDKTKPFQDERERIISFADKLKDSDNAPTYIIDSGGGIQAFWLLNLPLDANKTREAEAYSRGLADQYDTDKVQNIDRIMRIPYTLNIPDSKKRKAGRTEAPAKVHYAASRKGDRYDYLELDTFITASDAAESDNGDFPDAEIDMGKVKLPLSTELKDKLKSTIKKNKKVNDLWNDRIAKATRSERDFTLAKELKWEQYTLQEVGSILWNFKHGKGIEQNRREIVRSYMRADNPFEGTLSAEQIASIEAQPNPLKMEHGEVYIKPTDEGFPLREGAKATYKNSGIPLLKGLMNQKELSVTYGPSNSGKSFLTLDMAVHIAAGENWGKFKLKKKMAVLYICAEAGASFGKRVYAARERVGVDPTATLSDFPLAYIDVNVDLLNNKEHIKKVILSARNLEVVSGHKLGLIIVDTLAATFVGGNENSSEDMGKYINGTIKTLQHQCDTAVNIVHHAGKDESAGARGHSSLRAAVDTEFQVRSEKNGDKYKRTLTPRKQRDDETDNVLPFGLKVIELAIDEDGDAITTCSVVLEDDDDFSDVSPSIEDQLDANAKAALEAIHFYNSISNPDMQKIKPRHAEVQLKALIHNDILKSNSIFGISEKTFDLKDVLGMAKASPSIKKAFGRGCDKLRTLEITQENVKHQLVRAIEDIEDI